MEFTEVLQHFTVMILCLDSPLKLFLLYCRCTLKLFLVYLNSCIYKGGKCGLMVPDISKSFVHNIYIYIHIYKYKYNYISVQPLI